MWRCKTDWWKCDGDIVTRDQSKSNQIVYFGVLQTVCMSQFPQYACKYVNCNEWNTASSVLCSTWNPTDAAYCSPSAPPTPAPHPPHPTYNTGQYNVTTLRTIENCIITKSTTPWGTRNRRPQISQCLTIFSVHYCFPHRVFTLYLKKVRRLHLDLLFCYKIVFGLVSVNFTDFFQFSVTSSTRGHKYKLFKPRCTSSLRQVFCRPGYQRLECIAINCKLFKVICF